MLAVAVADQLAAVGGHTVSQAWALQKREAHMRKPKHIHEAKLTKGALPPTRSACSPALKRSNKHTRSLNRSLAFTDHEPGRLLQCGRPLPKNSAE